MDSPSETTGLPVVAAANRRPWRNGPGIPRERGMPGADGLRHHIRVTQAPRPAPGPSASADMLWKRRPLLEWILDSAPGWACETIRSWDEAIEPACGVFALQFLLRTQRGTRSIDVRRIVGQRAHYSGKTWLEAIASVEFRGRMRTALVSADDNPWYYFTPAPRDNMSLVSFDGEAWYSSSGVHRAIVAKFLHAYYQAETGFHPHLHNVPTIQHVVDQDSLQAYLKLDRLVQDLNLPISMSVKTGARDLQASSEDEDVFEAPRIHVSDRRLCDGAVQESRVLTPKAFGLYANWVCQTAGSISRTERMRYAVGRALSPAYDAFSLAIGTDCARSP